MAANDMQRPSRGVARVRPAPPGPALGLWVGVAIGLYGCAFVDSRLWFVAAAAAIGTLGGLAADPRLSRRDRWIAGAAIAAVALYSAIHFLVTR